MKTKHLSLAAVLVLPLLAGCTIVHDTKSTVVHAGGEPVIVTANATSKCWNVILFDWCRLYLTVDQQR
jgi:hypothetical protein